MGYFEVFSRLALIWRNFIIAYHTVVLVEICRMDRYCYRANVGYHSLCSEDYCWTHQWLKLLYNQSQHSSMTHNIPYNPSQHFSITHNTVQLSQYSSITHNTLQPIPVLFNDSQYSTTNHRTLQWLAILYNPSEPSSMTCNTEQTITALFNHGTIEWFTLLYNLSQHSLMTCNTVQLSQHSWMTHKTSCTTHHSTLQSNHVLYNSTLVNMITSPYTNYTTAHLYNKIIPQHN